MQSSHRGSAGVGLLLSPQAVRAWKAASTECLYTNFGPRIISMRLLVNDDKGRPFRINLISAYAPIGSADDKDHDDFEFRLNTTLAKCHPNDVLNNVC